MPTMSKEEYEKLYGPRRAPELSPEEARQIEERQLQEASDWRRRVARRGFLFDDKGQPWRVPNELIDLYREKYPELGEDLPDQWRFTKVGRASDDR